MTRRGKDKFLTEYQVINQWRNNVVNSDYMMTTILLPLSVGIFSTYFIKENSSLFVKFVYLIASLILIVFWRIYAFSIDKKIRDIYPRICYLEEKFSFTFTREYLKSEWWPKKDKSWLPTGKDVEDKIEGLSWKDKYFSRGHGMLNGIAIIIICGEIYSLFFHNLILIFCSVFIITFFYSLWGKDNTKKELQNLNQKGGES